jgi:hypothetical protein
LLLALVGWVFVFTTAGWSIMIWSVASLSLGAVAYLLWAGTTKKWPFRPGGAGKLSDGSIS